MSVSAREILVAATADMDTICYTCKLYGNIWLLEQIADLAGVTDDLLSVFQGDIGKTNDVLAYAIYVVIENRSFSRMQRWLNTHQMSVFHPVEPDVITRFTQQISEQHRMLFIQARLKRIPDGDRSSVDSTTRSGYGKCLVDLRWGNNKDTKDLPCSVESFVYSLTTHTCFYYKRFPGNTSDMVTIRTICSELSELGVKADDLSFMTDRGYTSKENMGILRKRGFAFLMCAKVSQAPVIGCLLKIEYDEVGFPMNMEYDAETQLYCAQFDADAFVVTLEDGEEYKVEDIKVNVYLDVKDRPKDLLRVRNAIRKEQDMINEMKAGITKIPDLKRLQNTLKYHYARKNKETGAIDFSENKEAQTKAYAQCGFFASCMYKHKLSAIEAYHEYRTRDEQEKTFFGLKDDEGADKQQCSSEEALNGRSFIFFVGMILQNILRNTWKQKLRSQYKTSYEILDTMETIRYSQYLSGNTHMTTFNADQIAICDAFGITPPQECMTNVSKDHWRKAHSSNRKGKNTNSDAASNQN